MPEPPGLVLPFLGMWPLQTLFCPGPDRDTGEGTQQALQWDSWLELVFVLLGTPGRPRTQLQLKEAEEKVDPKSGSTLRITLNGTSQQSSS